VITMKKFLLAVGAAVGYLVGTEKGRAKLSVWTGKAKQAWQDPKVQEKVHQATETVKEQAPIVAERLKAKASRGTDDSGPATGHDAGGDAATATQPDADLTRMNASSGLSGEAGSGI
jgi:hypothetical protein